MDPCSCINSNPTSIVDLGLLEEICIDGSKVEVCLVPTTPMCLYMTQIMTEVKENVNKIEGVDEVSVKQDLDTLWTRERMSDQVQNNQGQKYKDRFRDQQPTDHLGSKQPE
jgi:metal-sulfur cluster biosynthetic enzyme